MHAQPIETEVDYEIALAQLAEHFARQPVRETPEAALFEEMLALIGEYEKRVHPI